MSKNCGSCSGCKPGKNNVKKLVMKNDGWLEIIHPIMGGLIIIVRTQGDMVSILNALKGVALFYSELEAYGSFEYLLGNLGFLKKPFDSRLDSNMDEPVFESEFLAKGSPLFENVSLKFTYIEGLRIVFPPGCDSSASVVLNKMAQIFSQNEDEGVSQLMRKVSLDLSQSGVYCS